MRVLRSLMAAVLLTAATGCGATIRDTQDSLTLYAAGAGGDSTQQWLDFIGAAEKQDPSLHIKLAGPSFTDYWTKVKLQVASGDIPCLLTTQSARTQELADVLMPLDGLMRKHHLAASGFNRSMLDGMTVDGKILALPYDAEPIVMFYNKKAFADAGLEPPGAGYSTARFEKDARALTGHGRYGYAVPTTIDTPLAFAVGQGVPRWTKGSKLDLVNPELDSVLQDFFDLVGKDHVARVPDEVTTNMQDFIAGKAAMTIEGPWSFGSYQDQSDFPVGVTSVPSADGKPHGMLMGSGFGIAKGCPHPDEAFEAVEKLTSPATLAAMAQKEAIVPSRGASMTAWAKGKHQDMVAAVTQSLATGVPEVATAEWNQVNTLYTQYVADGFSGRSSAAKVFGTIQRTSEAAVPPK